MKANFLGLPVNLSFAKGMTLKLSKATITITHEIYSGWSASSRKEAILPVVSNNKPVRRIVKCGNSEKCSDLAVVSRSKDGGKKRRQQVIEKSSENAAHTIP